MQQPLVGCCSLNSALMLTKFDSTERGKFSLSFALFFSSSEHFLPKERSQKFRSISGGEHGTIVRSAMVAQMLANGAQNIPNALNLSALEW
jgi:hypothetical protein